MINEWRVVPLEKDQDSSSWIIKIKINNKKEIDNLFKPKEIISWLDSIIKKGE